MANKFSFNVEIKIGPRTPLEVTTFHFGMISVDKNIKLGDQEFDKGEMSIIISTILKNKLRKIISGEMKIDK